MENIAIIAGTQNTASVVQFSRLLYAALHAIQPAALITSADRHRVSTLASQEGVQRTVLVGDSFAAGWNEKLLDVVETLERSDAERRGAAGGERLRDAAERERLRAAERSAVRDSARNRVSAGERRRGERRILRAKDRGVEAGAVAIVSSGCWIAANSLRRRSITWSFIAIPRGSTSAPIGATCGDWRAISPIPRWGWC